MLHGAKHYCSFTEQHLQAVWLEQKYFKNFKTSTGGFVEVLSPGAWNTEAGPDFLHAHLCIGGENFRGDIEIHLRPESWKGHHHDSDPNYNDVILHLCLWKSSSEKDDYTEGGRKLVVGYLEDFLTISLARIETLIDLDLYPYKRFTGSGKCSHSIFTAYSVEKSSHIFELAAYWRLRKKLSYLRTKISDPSMVMKAGIAMALGYKNNVGTFLDLFFLLNSKHIYDTQELLAIMMGVCGYFEERYRQKWGNSQKHQMLFESWLELSHDIPLRFKMITSNVRPLNNPIRRFVVMARLISDPKAYNLQMTLESIWNVGWHECFKRGGCSRLFRVLSTSLPVYSDTYWNSHYLFEVEEASRFVPLVGADLRKNIIVNTFLPLLFDSIGKRDDPREVAAFEMLFRAIPASYSHKAKYLAQRFFGSSIKKSVLNNSFAEQGAFQIHHDFCTHYETSCEGCDFINRYKKESLYVTK